MKNLKIFLTIILSSLLVVLAVNAATILTTQPTDTINTFRTNVNSSLTNLNTGTVYSLNSATGTITFATSTDTNLGLLISTSTGQLTFTPVWIGTLADGRITSAGTWNAKQDALSFPLLFASTTHLTATIPLIITAGDISIPTSTSAVSGYLSSDDWTTFNNKLSTAIISLGGLTGDTQTFATSTGLNIVSSGTSHTFSLRNLLQLWSGIATTTGNLYIGSNANGWTTLASATAGKVLMASSTAQGMSWETLAGGGITSLGGQTGTSQTFATSTATSSISIDSAGDVHTFSIGRNLDIFNALATTTNAFILGSNASGWLSITASSSLKTALGGANDLFWRTATSSLWADLGILNNVVAHTATTSQAVDLGLGSNAYNSTAFLTSGTATSSKSITVESPTATDDITIFTPKYPITINRVSCINNPVSGNSVTFNLKHHTLRETTATSTDVFGVNKVCSATSTPTYWTAADFNDATLAVDEIFWLTTSAASSTAINVSVDFTYD